jgi:predicted nucleic acid-binding protein
MVYVDTSVLLAFTLTKGMEPARFQAASRLFNLFEALRRFLDVHRPELLERFIREDVEWGLHGEE